MTPVGVHYQLVGSSLSTWWEFTINSVGVYYQLCGSLLPTWWEFTIKLVGVPRNLSGDARRSQICWRMPDAYQLRGSFIPTPTAFTMNSAGVYYQLGLISTKLTVNHSKRVPRNISGDVRGSQMCWRMQPLLGDNALTINFLDSKR